MFKPFDFDKALKHVRIAMSSRVKIVFNSVNQVVNGGYFSRST